MTYVKTYLSTLKTHVVNLKRDAKGLSRDLQRLEVRGKLGSKTLYCEELMVSMVSGLQLTIASASTMKVLKDSSSSWVPWRSSMDANTFLTDLIWRSHTPPIGLHMEHSL